MEYMSKLHEEFNKNFHIGTQGLQACNASILFNTILINP